MRLRHSSVLVALVTAAACGGSGSDGGDGGGTADASSGDAAHTPDGGAIVCETPVQDLPGATVLAEDVGEPWAIHADGDAVYLATDAAVVRFPAAGGGCGEPAADLSGLSLSRVFLADHGDDIAIGVAQTGVAPGYVQTVPRQGGAPATLATLTTLTEMTAAGDDLFVLGLDDAHLAELTRIGLDDTPVTVVQGNGEPTFALRGSHLRADEARVYARHLDYPSQLIAWPSDGVDLDAADGDSAVDNSVQEVDAYLPSGDHIYLVTSGLGDSSLWRVEFGYDAGGDDDVENMLASDGYVGHLSVAGSDVYFIMQGDDGAHLHRLVAPGDAAEVSPYPVGPVHGERPYAIAAGMAYFVSGGRLLTAPL